MKTHLFIALLCAAAFAARAQSTPFIYQGRLAANSSPYTGLAEMQFTLFSTLTGGVAVATNSPATTNVNVSAGLFTVLLDFGAGAFPGADRFLEILVRTNVGAFTTLTPRQPLTPTPYALFVRTAGTAQGPWVLTESERDLAYTLGKVGIGTTFPSTSLHIAHDASPIIILQDTASALTQSGYIGFWNDQDETASVGFGTSGIPLFAVVNTRSGGDIALLPGSGNVGIGTATPQARLDVRGDIRLGASGEYRAASGEENLRIIRGTINYDGTILAGQGTFKVFFVSTGDYRIDFSTPFSSTPSVTASVDDRFEENVGVDFYVASVFSPSTSSVRVRTRVHSDNITTGPLSQKFHFIVAGPQ